MNGSKQNLDDDFYLHLHEGSISDTPARKIGRFFRIFILMLVVSGFLVLFVSSCNIKTSTGDPPLAAYNSVDFTSHPEIEIPALDLPELPSIDLSQFETSSFADNQYSTDIPTQPDFSITIVSYPKSVRRNEDATVVVKGKPNTKYYITVTYSSGASTADGLNAKYSNSSGYVSWTWHVGGKTNPGTFSITVSGNGDSKTVYFHVTT